MKLFSKKYIRLPLIIAVIAAVVLAGINQLFFVSHDKYVNASLELLYDGAASGLAPNGELFRIDNIKSEANLEAAISASGLDISVKELKDNIVIHGVYPDDLAKQIAKFDSLLDSSTSREIGSSDYNPTKFSITLNNNFEKKLSKATLINLFECVINQYKTFFADTYSAKIDWNIVENVCNTENQDYFQDIENMQYEVSLMKELSRQLVSVDATFELDGAGFNDFASSCESFDSNTLSGLLANVYFNGLSKDTQRLERKYTLQLKELGIKKAELTDGISNIDALINSYSKDSSIYISSESGNASIKSNSNETYEKLVDEKKNLTQDLILVDSDISKIEEDVKKITEANVDETNSVAKSRLETSIESARKKLDSLKLQFTNLCDAFNKEHASEDVLKVSAVNFFGANKIPAAFVKQCIKFGIVTVGLAVMYILCYEVFEELRKKKGNC